jgi:hypothetical protein
MQAGVYARNLFVPSVDTRAAGKGNAGQAGNS